MTETEAATIEILAPRFELHELITLHWNGEQVASRITCRRFDPDKALWIYGVDGSMAMYIDSQLSPRAEIEAQ